MMRNLLYLFILSLCFLSCKKDNSTQQLSGDYSGTFRTLAQGKLMLTQAFDVSLTEDRFKVTKGFKMGSGSYQIGSNNQAVFQDENPWTADFNWNLLLSGNYTYQIKGDSLILTKIFEPSGSLASQYRLKKIK